MGNADLALPWAQRGVSGSPAARLGHCRYRGILHHPIKAKDYLAHECPWAGLLASNIGKKFR
jgi:hypothetical protein